jgi:hypothetical protein
MECSWCSQPSCRPSRRAATTIWEAVAEHHTWLPHADGFYIARFERPTGPSRNSSICLAHHRPTTSAAIVSPARTSARRPRLRARARTAPAAHAPANDPDEIDRKMMARHAPPTAPQFQPHLSPDDSWWTSQAPAAAVTKNVTHGANERFSGMLASLGTLGDSIARNVAESATSRQFYLITRRCTQRQLKPSARRSDSARAAGCPGVMD